MQSAYYLVFEFCPMLSTDTLSFTVLFDLSLCVRCEPVVHVMLSYSVCSLTVQYVIQFKRV